MPFPSAGVSLNWVGNFPTCAEEIENDGSTDLTNPSHLINLSIDDYSQVCLFYLTTSPCYETAQDIGYLQIMISPNKGLVPITRSQ